MSEFLARGFVLDSEFIIIYVSIFTFSPVAAPIMGARPQGASERFSPRRGQTVQTHQIIGIIDFFGPSERHLRSDVQTLAIFRSFLRV